MIRRKHLETHFRSRNRVCECKRITAMCTHTHMGGHYNTDDVCVHNNNVISAVQTS